MILRIPVRGSSMRPSLAEGDEVVVRLASGRECRVGDVVLVLQGTATVLHRVVARTASRVWTRGDALPHLDDPVAPERVLGIADLPRRPLRSAMGGVLCLAKATIYGTASKWLRVFGWLAGATEASDCVSHQGLAAWPARCEGMGGRLRSSRGDVC